MIRASLARGSLRENARRLCGDAPRASMIADLRRDAWGRGGGFVARALAEIGVRRAVVDDATAPLLAGTGVMSSEGPATIDGELLYGFRGPETVPVMRVSGRVLSTKPLRAGEAVSYNYTFRADADTRLALVTGGFGHGIPRALGNCATVEIGGSLFPIVGRVAMDVCVVDTGDVAVSPGDEAVYFGGTGPARRALMTWTTITGCLPAELVCAIGTRAFREEVP